MGMKHFKAYTPSRRNMAVSTYEEVTKTSPEKSLLEKKRKIFTCKKERKSWKKQLW